MEPRALNLTRHWTFLSLKTKPANQICGLGGCLALCVQPRETERRCVQRHPAPGAFLHVRGHIPTSWPASSKRVLGALKQKMSCNMGREAESCLLCLWLVLALCVVLWVLCSLGSGGVGPSLIAHLSSALTRGVLGWQWAGCAVRRIPQGGMLVFMRCRLCLA